MKPQNTTERKAIETTILDQVSAAKAEVEAMFRPKDLLEPDARRRKARMVKNSLDGIYYQLAALIGDNAYIRQVKHVDGYTTYTTYTTWEVGTFAEIGKYKVLADDRQPHKALASAIYITGAILPAANAA